MKRNRKNAGFSMGELLVVVAILVILMGLAFVGLFQHQRNLKQLELDGIAKEIFVAAQNHLTMADSQGLLEGLDEGDTDAIEAKLGSSVSGKAGEYYFVAGKSATAPHVWDLMLPFGAVDETVRAGGSYVIHYNKTSARVLDVFYAQPDNSRFGHTFTEGEYATLLGLSGDTNKAARRSCGDDKHVIGWFGGEGLTEGKPLAKPTLQIINAERLVVKVTNPNTSGLLAEQNEFNDLIIQLQITGMSSGAECVISLAGKDKPKPNYEYVLDDITTEKGHFKDVVKPSNPAKQFIPGENISVQVKAWHNNSEAAIVYSASKQTNSLFASLDEVTSPANQNIAYISNIRHLENLGSNVSGYTGKLASTDLTTIGAKQISDLSWPDFLEKIADQKKMEQKDVQVTGTSKAGVYLPANPDYALDYDGQGYRIADVTVDYDGAAGIFGTLNNSNIKRVLVCNDNTKVDSALEILGSGNTGGLVGEMNGGSIDFCAAAVYVYSSNGSAGGLIGQTTGSVSVTKSYSGGHTIDGVYQNSDSGQGRYNVQASGNAGGLIGAMSGTTSVTNCYSTCSAKGDASGGLIGSASGGNVTTCYCYATGLVGGNGTKGAFIGSGTPGTLTGNAYYSIINGEVPAVGSAPENKAVAAFDGNLDSYNQYLTMQNPAQPYDDALRTYYGGQYALKTISQLAAAGTDAPAWVSAHYGDWPAPETLVVNVKQEG